MVDDCIVGGLTNEEARQVVVAYFRDNYTLPHEVIYPREKEPGLEDRDEAFIILNILGIDKEQAGMGMREFITDKFLDISLWTKADAGMKETSVFEDFVDSIAINISEGVAFGTPKPLSEKDFKGWVVNTLLLPFKF